MAKAQLASIDAEVVTVTLEPGDRVAVRAPGQAGYLLVDSKGNLVLVGFDQKYYSYTRQQWNEYGKVAHGQVVSADAG